MSRVVHKPLIPAGLLLLALALPSSAQASASAVIRDCAQDGHLDGHYSNAELRQARDNLPSDLDEYSDCRDVISAAITSGSGRGGGPAAPSSAPKAQKRVQHAKTTRHRSVARPHKHRFRVAGKVVDPSRNGLFKPASSTQTIPLPLLLALIAGGLLAAAAGVMVLRRRIPALSNLSFPRVTLPRLRRR
jgi:hypothetical protein